MERRTIDGLIWTSTVGVCLLIGTRLTLSGSAGPYVASLSCSRGA